MATLQLYSNLIAKLNGELLWEGCAITIEDRVGKPARVTIEQVIPQSGPEFNARLRLGEVVTIAIHLTEHRKPAALLAEISGAIVSCTTHQPEGAETAVMKFTVESRAERTL